MMLLQLHPETLLAIIDLPGYELFAQDVGRLVLSRSGANSLSSFFPICS